MLPGIGSFPLSSFPKAARLSQNPKPRIARSPLPGPIADSQSHRRPCFPVSFHGSGLPETASSPNIELSPKGKRTALTATSLQTRVIACPPDSADKPYSRNCLWNSTGDGFRLLRNIAPNCPILATRKSHLHGQALCMSGGWWRLFHLVKRNVWAPSAKPSSVWRVPWYFPWGCPPTLLGVSDT